MGIGASRTSGELVAAPANPAAAPAPADFAARMPVNTLTCAPATSPLAQAASPSASQPSTPSGATRSPSGMGLPYALAMSATRLGIDVTTITGTPAARISAARRPTSSEKPATITAMSSPSYGEKAGPAKYPTVTRACAPAPTKAERTCAATSPGAESSMSTLTDTGVLRALSMSVAASMTALRSMGSFIAALLSSCRCSIRDRPSR